MVTPSADENHSARERLFSWAVHSVCKGMGLEARNAVLSRYLGPLMVDFIPESHGDLPSKLSMVADITKNWNLRLK